MASLLEAAAHRSGQRGDASAAVARLTRAAELSPGAAGRGRRLAQAAYIGAETIGEMKDTQQLLEAMRQAGAQASDPLYYLPAATFVMLNGDGHIDTIHRLLVGAIEGGHHGYDASDATLVNAMWSLGLVSWSGGRAELWEPFLALMNRLSPQPPALLALNIDMWADPVRTGMAALPRLDAALRAVQREVDPHVIENLTASAIYADRLADFREPLWRMVQRGREGGPARKQITALVNLCLVAGQGVQPQGLAPVGVRFAEGHPAGQGLEVGAVEVHLDLIARLGVEARLRMQAVDIGVDVHDEHRAALAGKHVQVVDVQLAGLSRQRRIQMMRHGGIPIFREPGGGAMPHGRSGYLRRRCRAAHPRACREMNAIAPVK